MQAVSTDGFLADESRLAGTAEQAFLVQKEADIVDFLVDAQARQLPVTTQGGLTGITGAAVPQGGYALNLRNMRRVLGIREDADGYVLRVEPGCTLDGIRRLLLDPRTMDTAWWSEESVRVWRKFCTEPIHMFAPDLTETGATLGGVVSTNGSGARSYRYGAARQHVESLRVVLVGGDVLALRRGRDKADDRHFKLQGLAGGVYEGDVPAYKMPQVKHAAGLYAMPDMDLLDLFIGAEGTLGVISEVEIRLLPRPEQVFGLTVFLSSEEAALQFVEQVRGSQLDLQALEYFSSQALDLLRQPGADAAGGVPVPPLLDHWHTAIYVEVCGDAQEAIVEMVATVGGDIADTWLAEGYAEIETLKGIRHAIPERINSWIAERRKMWPAVTKLGTDLAVPDASLRDVMQMYHTDLQAAGLPYVIFGHIGNNHVHVNIVPPDEQAWKEGKALYGRWAERVVSMGGTVSAEHGIGKLKVDMLRMMFGEEGIAQMRAVKAVFDPDMLLNRGTLFGDKI